VDKQRDLGNKICQTVGDALTSAANLLHENSEPLVLKN
jgi:hypothetical protein